jgi:hypothetical protein
MKTTLGLFVCACVCFAQPGNAIIGIWSGQMGQGDSRRVPLRVEFHFDGKTFTGRLTGPPNPGEIQNGSFDEATGMLKFQVRVEDSGGMVVEFEGMAWDGSATGRVKFPDTTGFFKLTKGENPGADVAELRKSFTEVSTWVAKAADLVPEEKYSFQPAPAVRSFARQVAHIADSYDYYCGRRRDSAETGPLDKATLAARLASAQKVCASAYARGGGGSALVGNIAHTNLHYGNLVTYLRMMGLTPPSN